MQTDVIIVGAGLSGLTAAQHLMQAGFKTIVLEARSRLGGRIHTLRNSKSSVDLGASWAHDLTHNTLMQSSLATHLQQIPFSDLLSQLEDHIAYDENYQQISQTDAKAITTVAHDFLQTLVKADPNTPANAVLEAYQHPALFKLPTIAVKRWLAQLTACWSGATLSQTGKSLWQAMQQEGPMTFITNGYDKLIEQLSLGLTIHCNETVNCIDTRDPIIHVHTSRHQYQAKTVLVTLPIGVLQAASVEFLPALPAMKQEAIAQIGRGQLEKTVLSFPHCFWDKTALSLQRLPNQESAIQVYVNYQAIEQQPILVAYYAGGIAKDFHTLTSEARSHALLMPLMKIYGSSYVAPTQTVSTDWYHDPFTLGSYAYLPTHDDSSCFETLAKPVDNKLFFAGEATHRTHYATVHGAYESGLRAFKEISNKA